MIEAKATTRVALVVVMSPILRDPRVRRQLEWLADAGWDVDTIGLGPAPPRTRDHFSIGPLPRWLNWRLGGIVLWVLLPHFVKFRFLSRNRIPAEVRRRARDGRYALIVFNDHHFIPWIADRAFHRRSQPAHVHLDMHEYMAPTFPRTSLWRRFTAPYNEWIRAFIGHPRFDTRSTVVGEIADLYAREFEVALPTVVRSAPPYVEQGPGPVDPDRIRLLHHGAAHRHRGIPEMIDAMRLLDDRFELTLMLVGTPSEVAQFESQAREVGGRIVFRDPVPMPDLPVVINEYDLEVMFYPPRTRNLEFALPNKLFEAVQGRLGLVIGESAAMAEIVTRYANGVVVSGWSSADLAAALNALDAAQVETYKAASHLAARGLSAEAERAAFLGQFDRTARPSSSEHA